MSKYKAEWNPLSKNEDFWTEVLVGRKIERIEFDSEGINALILDSKERVELTLSKPSGKATFSIED